MSKSFSKMKHIRLILVILIAVTAIFIAFLSLDTPWGAPNPDAQLPPEGPVARLQQQTSLEVTYIANEGVLISSGDKQVLIDGLHREYKRSYAFLPAAQREKIETAKAPFDRIDLILVSHLHLDHFHPESIGLHLKHNPTTTLVSSQQVVDEIEKNFKDYEAIRARVVGATPRLLPFWFLIDQDGQRVVREHIKPKHIIAVHISPCEAETVARQIKQFFPDAVAFTTMLERRHY